MTRITGCIFIDNIDIVQPYFTKMLPSKFIVGHKYPKYWKPQKSTQQSSSFGFFGHKKTTAAWYGNYFSLVLQPRNFSKWQNAASLCYHVKR